MWPGALGKVNAQLDDYIRLHMALRGRAVGVSALFASCCLSSQRFVLRALVRRSEAGVTWGVVTFFD